MTTPLVLCAAFRKTPPKLQPLLESFFDHSRWAPIVYIGVNDDDLETLVWLRDMPVEVIVLDSPPQGSAKSLHAVLRRARRNHNASMLVFADDCEMLTPRYDEALGDLLGPRAELLFLNDGRKGRDLVCHPLITPAFFDLCHGWPRVEHYYADTWLEATARYASALRYIPHITMKHHVAGNDDPAYLAHKAALMEQDRKIFLDGHAERKLDALNIRRHNEQHE